MRYSLLRPTSRTSIHIICPSGSSISGTLMGILFGGLKLCEARGGGSKRTFGSQNSPNSQSPNLGKFQNNSQSRSGFTQNSHTHIVFSPPSPADCQDSACQDSSDIPWTSLVGATMALVGPLLVLLSFIIMIKLCFSKAYPKEYQMDECPAEVENPKKDSIV